MIEITTMYSSYSDYSDDDRSLYDSDYDSDYDDSDYNDGDYSDHSSVSFVEYVHRVATHCAFGDKPLEKSTDEIGIDHSSPLMYSAMELYDYIKTKQYNKISEISVYLNSVVYHAIKADDLVTIYELEKFDEMEEYLYNKICFLYKDIDLGKNVSRHIYNSHDKYGGLNEFAMHMIKRKSLFVDNLRIVTDIRPFMPKDIWHIIANYW